MKGSCGKINIQSSPVTLHEFDDSKKYNFSSAMRAELLMTLISSCLTLLLILMLLATPGEAAVAKTKLKQSKTPSVTTEHITVKANHHHHHHTAGETKFSKLHCRPRPKL